MNLRMMMNKYDKSEYERDFPDHGDFNWKRVVLKTPEIPYYDGHKVIGVVLHDGNFMVNGVLFLSHQFEVIEGDPVNVTVNPGMEKQDLESAISAANILTDLESWIRDEICERRSYSATKTYEVVIEKIDELRKKYNK